MSSGNTTTERMRRGEKLCASWAQLTNNISAEILAEAGFDVIVPDMEHAPYTLSRLVSVLQAIKGTGCFSMVRAPWNDAVIIKQILDCGAQGIHVPYVSTREEAEYAVKCCKYPLEGIRGVASSQRATCYGMQKMEYFARANKDIIVMVAIETPEGVANVDEIASVEGLDGIFIGPSDLSTSMGHFYKPSDPEVQEAIRKIEKAAKEKNKFLATAAADFDSAKVLYDRGYTLVYYMSDVSAVANAAAEAVGKFREQYEKGSAERS